MLGVLKRLNKKAATAYFKALFLEGLRKANWIISQDSWRHDRGSKRVAFEYKSVCSIR